MKKNYPLHSQVLFGILSIIILMFILHVASYLHLLQNNLDPKSFFFQKTNFDSERNLPAIFSGILYFIASLSLAAVRTSDLKIKSAKWSWWLLCFIFLFLGFDEILVIHEKFEGNDLRLAEQNSFLYNWVIVYGTGILVLGAFLARSLYALPRRTLRLIILAGFIYVLGAMVLESIAGNLVYQRQLEPEIVKITPAVFILATLEELFEMLGLTLFIYAILKFLHHYRETKN